MKKRHDSADPDLEWVRRSREGEGEAFSTLVRKYQRRLFRMAYGMLGNTEDAEDVTQEAWIKAYRSLDGFREGSGFYTWLYRITYNLCIDFRRREWRGVPMEYDERRNPGGLDTAPPSVAGDPHRAAVDREMQGVILGAIRELPEVHRAVILLREVEGLSYADIARTLGIRKGTVMSRLHYARQQLQRVLAPYVEGGGDDDGS